MRGFLLVLVLASSSHPHQHHHHTLLGYVGEAEVTIAFGLWGRQDKETEVMDTAGSWERQDKEVEMMDTVGSWGRQDKEVEMMDTVGSWGRQDKEVEMMNTVGSWGRQDKEVKMMDTAGSWGRQDREVEMMHTAGSWGKQEQESGMDWKRVIIMFSLLFGCLGRLNVMTCTYRVDLARRKKHVRRGGGKRHRNWTEWKQKCRSGLLFSVSAFLLLCMWLCVHTCMKMRMCMIDSLPRHCLW